MTFLRSKTFQKPFLLASSLMISILTYIFSTSLLKTRTAHLSVNNLSFLRSSCVSGFRGPQGKDDELGLAAAAAAVAAGVRVP